MLELISFPDHARVWIFQGNQEVPQEQINRVYHRIQEFTDSWTSHQNELIANGGILHQRFIIFVVDESKSGVSGCSIDKAVHFVQSLGHQLQIDFFDRNRYSYIKDDKVINVTADQFRELYQQGKISDNTFVFDNLVQTKKDFIDGWVKPLSGSWIERVVLR